MNLFSIELATELCTIHSTCTLFHINAHIPMCLEENTQHLCRYTEND